MTKRFGISKNAKIGLSQTIELAERNSEDFYSTFLPVDNIIPDPSNPRNFLINKQDILNNIEKFEIRDEKKANEFSLLRSLANSILAEGIINPIICFKKGEKYQIVAGERRWLASLLAGKTTIPARIFHSVPNEFQYKLVQYIENNEREDLSLFNRLMNIKSLLEAYKSQNSGVNLTTEKVSELTFLSKSQANNIMRVIQGDQDVLNAIECGQLESLKNAVEINSIKEEKKRKEALKMIISGGNQEDIKKLKINPKKKKGRPSNIVQLGKTKNLYIAKTIIESVLKVEQFNSFNQQITTINWDDASQVSRIFKKFLSFLEEKIN